MDKSPCFDCIAKKGCKDYTLGRTMCMITCKEFAKRAGITVEEAFAKLGQEWSDNTILRPSHK
jgi:hypothetical protein